MVADLHALTTAFDNTSKLNPFAIEMVIDWIASGIDPKRSVIFRQSDVPEHSELALMFGMLTPLSWVYRVPSFKEQIQQLGNRISTYGFLGYPVLQTADIALYKGEIVPVGEDQLPHLELSREIVRRFNSLYSETFPEPQPQLAKTPNILGIDGRKMSKSYDNTIDLADDDKTTAEKVLGMFTDPNRKRRVDPGNPYICNVYTFHTIFNALGSPRIAEECSTAKIGCVECKKIMSGKLNESLADLRKRRRGIEKKSKSLVTDILDSGAEKTRQIASQTMSEVKRNMKLTGDER